MNRILKYSFITGLIFIIACNKKETSVKEKILLPVVNTIHPIKGNIQENKQLNGQVIYLNKTIITAPLTGYVTKVNTLIGNYVNKGDLIFKIQTSENKALENTKILKSMNYGKTSLYANASGYINSLNITEPGIYITQGTALATIVNDKDLIIQVNTPYEYNKLIAGNKNIQIELPDKSILSASYYKTINMVDPVSQTQKIYFKLKKHKILPENLNVIADFITESKNNSILLPKEAVLTNETEDQFWIMKIINNSIAVRVPVEKGLEENGKTEILKPILTDKDLIIIKGAYGLSDSTKVKVEQP